MSNIIILAAIILYLGMVVWIGVICSKKNSDVGDFYLGGRKLGPVVTAMSAEASDMSSYLLMGVPGLAYLTGLADATWTAIGLALGTYLNWLIVAKKIRLYSHGYQAITLPDYFSKRFGDDKHVITLISAALIVIFFIPYTASGFAACGKLFNSLLGFDYHAAMIVSAVVIVLYCTMGGFLAASTSDLVQSIIMTFALAVVVIFGIVQAGGMGVVLDNAKALPGYLDMFHTHIAETNTSGDYGFFKIVSTLAWGLGYFGMPHILLRFMAIEDENKLKISRRIATVWVFISLIVATGIGVIGLTLSKSGIIDTLTGSESETIIVKISHYLSTFNPVAAFIAGSLQLLQVLSSVVFLLQQCQLQIHSFLQLHLLYHRTLRLRCYILICLRRHQCLLQDLQLLLYQLYQYSLHLILQAQYLRLFHLHGRDLVQHLVLLFYSHYSGSVQINMVLLPE